MLSTFNAQSHAMFCSWVELNFDEIHLSEVSVGKCSLYYLFSATCRGYYKRSIYTISALAFSIISPNSLATHALRCIGRAMGKLSKAERGRTNKTLPTSLLEDGDTPCKHEIQTHPLWYISIMMSLPPMNSPHTYSWGMVGH